MSFEERLNSKRLKYIEQNYASFQTILPTLLPEHRHEWALMIDREFAGIFKTPEDAHNHMLESCGLDGPWSIQEITNKEAFIGTLPSERY